MPKFVDLTPTWQQILPTWLMMYRQAIAGDCSNPDLIKANAVSEFESMALGADRWNALTKFAESNSVFSIEDFIGAHSDLFPSPEKSDPEEAADYEEDSCEECRGTGCHHMMGEYITDEPCEACSGQGKWQACTECGEPKGEGHLDTCHGGKFEAALKEQSK
jgi:hypothetical protein